MALTAIQRLSPIVDPLLTTPILGIDVKNIAPLPEGFIRVIPALSRESALPTKAEAEALINAAPIIKDTPKFTNATNAFWQGISSWAVQGVKGLLSGGTSYVSTTATELARKPPPPVSQPREATFSGAQPMSIFDDIGGMFGGGSSFDSGVDTSFNWNGLLNLGVGLATNALAPRGSAVPAMAPASMAAAPAIVRGAATVGRSLFNRFPNLATGIQRLRNAGQNVTRAKLYSVMKRFGPEFLVSGGLLTAAAVQELAVAGSGRRRMNPANAKALRRSVRRIESFHRLCKSTDVIKGRRRRC